MARKKIVILGAGITGLVAGYYLSKDFDVVILEKEKMVGGSAVGFQYKNFILDYGPHKIYSELDGIYDEIEKIVPLLKIKKKNSIYLNGNYFEFPLKIGQVLKKMPGKAFGAGFDIVGKNIGKLEDDSYENYLINRFGKTMYGLSFKDYAEKVWGTLPTELDAELAKKRVAIGSIFELIKSILIKDTKKISAEYFYYPPKGIKQLVDGLVEKITDNGGKIYTSANVLGVGLNGNNVESVKIRGGVIRTDYLISTIGLDDLSKLMNSNTEIVESAKKLSYQKLNIIYFVLNKNKALEDCWVFFPEKDFIFHRISEMKSFSPYVGPTNKTVLMVETTKDVNKEIMQEIIGQLENVGALNAEDIEEKFVKGYGRVYPIYTKGFMDHLNKVLDHVEEVGNLYSIGRPGLFNYNNMDQCWDMAMKTAEHIKSGKGKEGWGEVKEYFDNYRIVD